MSWSKLFRRGLTVIFILASLLTAVVVCAAIQIFDGTGQYIMSDFENHDIAKQRAQQRAELDAQKKAGVYLTSFSKSENMRLTVDEISAVTNNIIKVSDVKIVPVPFETNGEAGLMYRVTLKASIDPEGIYDYIKRDSKEKVTIVQQNNGLQDAIAKNDALIEDLKEQYKRATSQAEKDRIIKRMNDSDRDFLANQRLKEGNELAYAKDYEGAIKLYNEALKLNLNFDKAYYNLGTIYSQRLQQYEQAIKHFDKAIELNPNYTDAYTNRGATYSGLKQYDMAIKDYDKALKLNPNDSMAYYNRGLVYAKLGQYDQAIQDYNKAIKLNQNDSDYYTNRGAVYMDGLEQYERAIQDFNKAIALNPNDVDAYNNRGISYKNLKLYELAIADLDKVISLKPDYASAYNNRGLAYSELGQNERAIQDYTKSIELNNSNLALVYTNRGVSYALLGNFKRAIEDASKAIQINTNFVAAYKLRGLCYEKLGETEKAQADFAKAKELGYKG